MPEWRALIRARLAAPALDPARVREIVEELAQHLNDRYEEALAAGATPETAFAAAMAELPEDVALAREIAMAERPIVGRVWNDTTTRRARWGRRVAMMADVWQDVRHGLRMMRRNPGFASVAILTLALGMGANTAIFTVVDAVLLRALPFRSAERLASIYETTPDGERSPMSLPNLVELAERTRAFEPVSGFIGQSANLTGGEEPDRLRAGFVSASFFDLLGVAPALGRTFSKGDDKAGAEKVVVLDYGLWERRFARHPGVIGRTLVLNNEPFTVIGVMPARFRFPLDEIEIWMPAIYFPSTNLLSRGDRRFFAFGRLKDGVTLAQAQADLSKPGFGIGIR